MLPARRLFLGGNFRDSDAEMESDLAHITDQKDREN